MKRIKDTLFCALSKINFWTFFEKKKQNSDHNGNAWQQFFPKKMQFYNNHRILLLLPYCIVVIRDFKVKNRWLIWEVSSAFLLIVKSSMKDRALSMGKKPFELWICCQMQAVNQNQWWIWIHFDHPPRILIPPTAYKSSIIVGALGNWHVEKIPTVFSSSPRRKRTS